MDGSKDRISLACVLVLILEGVTALAALWLILGSFTTQAQGQVRGRLNGVTVLEVSEINVLPGD